jgi:hypothetical protein
MIQLQIGRVVLPVRVTEYVPVLTVTPPRVDLLPVLQAVLRDYEHVDRLLTIALESGVLMVGTSDVRADLLPKIATLKAVLARAEGRA